MPKKLLNLSIFALVAEMLGRKSIQDADGNVQLSVEDEEKIRQTYGEDFLENLKKATDSNADTVFSSMVAKAAEDAATIVNQAKTIADLRDSVNKLAKAPEQAPEPAAVKGKEAPASAIDMNALHNKAAANALANPIMGLNAVGESSIDIDDLNRELGSVMPAGVRLDILAKRIYNGFNDSKYLTRIQTNTDYKATAALMSEVSQQFTPAWTPKGKEKFTPCVIKYRRHKINVEFIPAEVIKSWLLYLYEQGKTPSEMPITLYLIENHILPKVCDDITLAMLGKGKFVEVNDAKDGDEGSAASASMDGYETILVEGRKSDKCKINFFKAAKDFRKMSDSEIINYVDSFVDAISPLFAKRLELHCSQEFYTRYKRADFVVNGKYTGIENDGSIRFTAFSLIPLESMYNSPILFATPRENFAMLVDLAAAEKCINKIAEYNYKVKVFGEYSLSVGFKIEEAVYAAVPDGYDPTATIATDATSVSDAWEHGKTPEPPKEENPKEEDPDKDVEGA